jgi:protein-tyrosine phosphatase
LETDPEIKARNRYINVQAWANSRIHLRVPEGECDFINASPIVLKGSSTGAETRYIATQVRIERTSALLLSVLTVLKGPKSGQLAHFWHMVFHETKEVAVIVMLTQTMESGREKCAQYFPLDHENASMELQVEPNDPFVTDETHEQVNDNMLGRITLKEYSYDEACRSEIRKLELTMGSKSKAVWHFLFAGWADYSKPEGAEREALLQLIKTTASKCSADNPRVVHCSAGVGRTGTFIALDHLLRELVSGELLKLTGPEIDPVFESVDQLREQRMTMVHNEMQLQFIYEVLKEHAELILDRRKAIGGGEGSNGGASDLRSPKVARLSEVLDLEVSTKPELE